MDHHRTDRSESLSSSSTLLWTQLEPWMDEEYLRRACEPMNWQPVAIRIPKLSHTSATGQQPNNQGYCYLVFRSPVQAAAALAQVGNGRETALVMMPYSSTPYVLCWAPTLPYAMNPTNPRPDYSIFIADLPPSATENDILRVFRYPETGQSPYREPKVVRPFDSCTRAKIILDSDGNSTTSAFVRFSIEDERNRALNEANGLCIKGRPIRVCPANDPKPHFLSQDFLQNISSQIVAANSNSSLESGSTQGSSSLGSSSSGGSFHDFLGVQPEILQLALLLLQRGKNNNVRNGKYRSQSKRLSSDLAGPKGEWLASTDPHNTTVFIGGLTPDITEDMLWTLFCPFGPIYYVKVVVDKDCAFVQFVRKADAACAINRMQNYPVNKTRIRLAWGNNSVQAAAAANNIQSSSNSWTLEQLLFLLQELYNLGLIQPNRGLSGAPNYSTNSGDNTLARNQHLMTSAGGITPVGGNKSRNDHPSSDNILGRSAAFFERTETRPWSDTRGAHSSFTPFSSDLVTLEDTIPSKAAREFLPFYSGNPTTQFGAESSSAASYPVPYSRVDRAVSRPDSKLSLDSQAESDHLSATFASLDLNSERDQQRQG